jgi:hypothetical protein
LYWPAGQAGQGLHLPGLVPPQAALIHWPVEQTGHAEMPVFWPSLVAEPMTQADVMYWLAPTLAQTAVLVSIFLMGSQTAVTNVPPDGGVQV